MARDFSRQALTVAEPSTMFSRVFFWPIPTGMRNVGRMLRLKHCRSNFKFWIELSIRLDMSLRITVAWPPRIILANHSCSALAPAASRSQPAVFELPLLPMYQGGGDEFGDFGKNFKFRVFFSDAAPLFYKELIDSRGCTQVEFAASIGISRGLISSVLKKGPPCNRNLGV